ncbi:hypothetical protein [Salicibibacter cibarius]|nr:hypothetical protein [Salicibibacter cibarius]
MINLNPMAPILLGKLGVAFINCIYTISIASPSKGQGSAFAEKRRLFIYEKMLSNLLKNEY